MNKRKLILFGTINTMIGAILYNLVKWRKYKNQRLKERMQSENVITQDIVVPHKKGFYEKYIKRLQDIILSFFAMLILSPVIIVVALLVCIKLGRPIIFKQRRTGVAGKIFTLYKFRTMTYEKDENGELLSDENRLTQFGKWLRSTSLDELPQLWNIFIGDLAVCGPRPLLPSYLSLYNVQQMRRHEVRPGLTGYAQVHGRNSLLWEERFDMDVYYVDHISLLGDWWIIIQTIFVVLSRKGINSEGEATMGPFKGSC